MKEKYFERIINNLQFNFIPIYSLKDNNILGYKIIKDFSKLGFNDKDYMYQLAYEVGIFKEFTLEILKKSFENILFHSLSSNFLFYTLRLNLIDDIKEFLELLDRTITFSNLCKNKIIFDIQGINDWKEFYKKYSSYFKYNIILKEGKTSTLNINNVIHSKAIFVEPRTLDTLIYLKACSNFDTPFIFNLKKEKEPLLSQIKALGIDYYYNY
ncbi:Uncharacterised protein [Fusobacterium necrogenes]|uniref:EAL domain-containing protein n=1 Tax=Fusobacterium necrogenes TaxID=858 RepID=A0A377GY49_9FUSO|nr:hypothetical protein [Fusobacterium necrogenes]STO31481.1 Uncharacterised protein [Fusobacterium necrogenes]